MATGWPSHLPPDDHRRVALVRFGNEMAARYGAPAHLVGSALLDANEDPRDWDVRVVLEDEEFNRRYGPWLDWHEEGATGRWTRLRFHWSDDCVKQTKMGWHDTGLNVDFQVYPASFARKFDHLPRLRLDTREDCQEACSKETIRPPEREV